MHHLYLPIEHSSLGRFTRGDDWRKLMVREEVRDWLLDNVGSERLVRREPWGEDTWYQGTTVDHRSFEPVHEIIFKYRKDAMLFKLTWL